MANGDGPDPGEKPAGQSDDVWQSYLAALRGEGDIPQSATLEQQQYLAALRGQPSAAKVQTPFTQLQVPTEAAPLQPGITAKPSQVLKATPAGAEAQWEKIQDVAPASLAGNDTIQNNIKAFRGNYLYNNEKGNPVYELGGTKYVLLPGDQYHDVRVFEGGRTENAELPTGYYMPAINDIVAKSGGIDPWTYKPYVDPTTGKSVAVQDMTDAQKMAFAGRIQAYNNSAPIEQGQQNQLQAQHALVDTYQKMYADMAKLSDDDLSKINQIKKGLIEWTGADFAGSGLDRDKQEALRDLQTHLDQLRAQGQAVLGAKEGERQPGVSMVGTTALGVIASTVSSLLQKGAATGENLATLRSAIPQSLNKLKKDYYETVSGLANQHARVDVNMRRYANEYAADLEHQGFGRTEAPEFSAPIKAAPSVPTPVGTATPAQAQPGGYETITPVPVRRRRPAGGLAGPSPTPTPAPAPPGPPGRMMFQSGGLVRAPISRPRATGPGQVPSYGSQAELDAAGHPPGTRFHWKPTNREYVKT